MGTVSGDMCVCVGGHTSGDVDSFKYFNVSPSLDPPPGCPTAAGAPALARPRGHGVHRPLLHRGQRSPQVIAK